MYLLRFWDWQLWKRQMPEIVVHIVSSTKVDPPTYTFAHERNAKVIEDELREKYGNGVLFDPKGYCVLPNPERCLVAGEYEFERCPEVIWEIRKFEAASIGDAISAAHFYQHTFVVGQNKRPLRVPPASKSKVRKADLAGLALHKGDSNPQAASKNLAEHHEMQLLCLGTNMGNDGYQVLDLRPFKDLFEMHTDQHWYTGGFDFALVPRAVSEKDMASQIQVGFVHHWSSVHKEGDAAYCTCLLCATHPSQERSTVRSRGERLEASHPRAILGLLAARCKQWEVAPVDVVVTDGETYDLFRYDGSNILLYRGLDGIEAYYALSEALK